MLYHDMFSVGLLVHDVIVLECGKMTVQYIIINICSFIRWINVSRINNHINISKDIVSVLPATVRSSI